MCYTLAMWQAYRNHFSMSSGGPGSGLYKSTDGGETWTDLSKNPGLPKGLLGKIGISVSPVNSDRLYAMIENQRQWWTIYLRGRRRYLESGQ